MPRLKEKLVAGGCVTTTGGAERGGQSVVLDAALPGDEKEAGLDVKPALLAKPTRQSNRLRCKSLLLNSNVNLSSGRRN